ncbi:Clp protease ClpP [Pseudomonas helleri]|uniref:ClpP-like prohead protease/major capsid protein fusion protein n=1 Tax=Pseudomonas helleri TaxID=1608996 RepID=UPI001294A40C|nr:ClpP-like prohead protease/major capsid protein fusion protein [Pseudomonas helleri]MQU22145.1 Clp protease ClpP [Pseudomonas helleri]
MRPKGSTTTNSPAESWYSIQAAAKRGSAIVEVFGDIGAFGISAKQFALDLKALGDVSHIDLRVNSPGGDVFDGIAIYNMLRNHPARVEGSVMGLAASMGSVVLMASDTINMPANAMIMIHKPWGIQGGDADAMLRYATLLDKVEVSMVHAYVTKTGKTPEEVHALLEAETWMSGAEALALGFADSITEPLQAFAALKSHRMKDYANMPESVKAFFDPRGSVTPPAAVVVPPVAAAIVPPVVAAVVPPVAAPAPAPAAVSEAEISARVLAAEASRRNAISASFTGFAAHGALMNACLNDMGCTVESANAKLLAALGAGTTPVGSVLPASHVHSSNGNLVGDSVRASLIARAGHGAIEASNGYNYMTLRELARASLADRGVGLSAYNPLQMVGLAFTHDSSDFGNILMAVAHKSLLQGWENADETFHLWTKKGELSDFKPGARVGLGEFPSLREVRPGAEYKHISVSDRAENIQLATYGEIFSITRQAIINDDMSVLKDVPMKMGMAAKATIGDLVYAVLTGLTKMRDGKALFHADRKNLLTGAGSALSIESLSAAKQAMALQKGNVDGKARNLNIRPGFVLTPIALEDKANQIIRSASVPTANVNAGVVNPIQNFATVIGEARLDDASSTNWYLAGKQGTDTIEVAYLNGVDTPFVDQTEGFTSDGVSTKVRIDAGVAALDYRGLTSSVGA